MRGTTEADIRFIGTQAVSAAEHLTMDHPGHYLIWVRLPARDMGNRTNAAEQIT